MDKEPICYHCANMLVWPYCLAFPDGIPEDIRLGENDHSEPVEGDHGLQFEPIVLEMVQRHGKHEGQEGTPEGGSQPGFSHVEGSVGGSQKLTKSGLSKVLKWSSSRYNEYSKKDAVDIAHEILTEGKERFIFNTGGFTESSDMTGGDYLVDGPGGFIAVGHGGFQSDTEGFVEQERFYFTERHGKHVGQEGTPEGGSQPGYSHVEGSVSGDAVGQSVIAPIFHGTNRRAAADILENGFQVGKTELGAIFTSADISRAQRYGRSSADGWREAQGWDYTPAHAVVVLDATKIDQPTVTPERFVGTAKKIPLSDFIFMEDIGPEAIIEVLIYEEDTLIDTRPGLAKRSLPETLYTAVVFADEPVSVQRHGKHVGQAGVEGQRGGSASGFTHEGASPEAGKGEAGLYISVPAGAYPPGTRAGNMHDIRQLSGAPIRGTVMSLDDERIPGTVWHMTTDLKGIMRGDEISASGEGGLGGDSADNIVSMTVKEEVAKQLAEDMKFAARIAKKFNDTLPEAVYDEKTMGWDFIDPETGEKLSPDEAASKYLPQIISDLNELDTSTDWEFKGGPVSVDSNYMPKWSATDWLRQYFASRDSQVDIENPIIFANPEELAALDPDNIGYLGIPKGNLDTGAMLTDFDLGRSTPDSGLHEIRLYGDVPLDGVRVTAEAFSRDGNVVLSFPAQQAEMASRGVLYRGMREGLLDTILENGFDPAEAVKWRDRPSAIYFTEDKALAADYGVAREIAKLPHDLQKDLDITHAGEQLTWGVVFEVKVPDGFSLQPDVEQEGDGHWFTEEAIPPEWITGYREATLDVDQYAANGSLKDSIHLGELVERAEGGTRTLYIGVAFGDNEEEIVERHGKHQEQAGVPGQKGGSAPGFTHVGAQAEPEPEGGSGGSGSLGGQGGKFGDPMKLALKDLKKQGITNFTPAGQNGAIAAFLDQDGHTIYYDADTNLWNAAGSKSPDELLSEQDQGVDFDEPLGDSLLEAEGADKASIEQASIDAAMASVSEMISPEATENFKAVGADENYAVFELEDNGALKVFNVKDGSWDIYDPGNEPKDADQLLHDLGILSVSEMGIVFEEGTSVSPASVLTPQSVSTEAQSNMDAAFATIRPSIAQHLLPIASNGELSIVMGEDGKFHEIDPVTGDSRQVKFPGATVLHHLPDDFEVFFDPESGASPVDAYREAIGQTIGGEIAPLRPGNTSLETYADAESDVKSATRAIEDLGFGETGKGHSGASDTQYLQTLMFAYDRSIRAAGYHARDQLQAKDQNQLKVILDAIEYESDRLGLATSSDLVALNATMQYPPLEEITGEAWNPDNDFILAGLESPHEVRQVQMAFQETPPLNAMDPSSVAMWTANGDLSRETSEQLYMNYLVRFNSPGSPEFTFSRREFPDDSNVVFGELGKVILKDRYSWVPRDEGTELEVAANSINRGWQVTTNSPSAIVLSEVVAAEHGGTSIPRENFDERRFRVGADSIGPAVFNSPEYQEDFAEIASQIYARTQLQLADAGMKRTDTVRLYRGMDDSGDESSWNPDGVENGLVEVDMYALSSWTPSVKIASRFGGSWIIAADIPVQRLWANADTGPPSKSEEEWMVLGGDGIEGAIASAASLDDIRNNRDPSFGESTTVSHHFDEVLASKAERPTISPDLTHMMWMAQGIENETGQDSSKVNVKDARDAEFTEESDREVVARGEAIKSGDRRNYFVEDFDNLRFEDEQPVERHGKHIGQEGTPEGGSQPGYTHEPGSVGGGEKTIPLPGMAGTGRREDVGFFAFDRDASEAWGQDLVDSLGEIDQQHAMSLVDYKTNNYRSINSFLRGDDEIMEDQPGLGRMNDYFLDVTVERLDSIMEKSKTLTDVVAFRGMDTEDQDLDQLQPGDTFFLDSYTSTTLSVETLRAFTGGGVTSGEENPVGLLVEIRVPKGTHAIWMDSEDTHERIGEGAYSEQELLLDRGIQYKVLEQGTTVLTGTEERSLVVEVVPGTGWNNIDLTERHGVHVGQEGVPGEAGGSQPGFTHAEVPEDPSEGPDEYGNTSGDYMTTTFDRNNQDIVVKLLKYEPNTSLDENNNWVVGPDDEGGDWQVEIMTGLNAGYNEGVADYELDVAPAGTYDTWETDESPGATLERAEGIFGITDFMSEAGFILPDGRLLDFSGGPGGDGMRGTDHRSISQALLDDQGGEPAKEYSGGLIYFMDHTGSVRVSYSGGRSGVSLFVDVSREPTQPQWRTIKEWAAAVDDLNIDISQPDSGSVLWSNSNPSDINGSLRELRAQLTLDELTDRHFDSGETLRITFRIGNQIPQDVSEAMDELMLALRALSTGDLKAFIRTRWGDYNSHLKGR